MSTQPRHTYTLEEYFALELASEEKYEFWDGNVWCMSGASIAHNSIVLNIGGELRQQLRETGCLAFPSDVRVKVPAYAPYRYPDLTALCDKPIIERVGGLELLTNPALIVEVLSDSTAAFDRGDKFTYYKSIESFTEYLIVAQHRPHVTRLLRGEHGVWSHVEYNDLAEAVQCSSVPCRLELSEIYRDVAFEPIVQLPPERD